MLQERSKKLRKSVYEIDENIKNTLPAKNTIDNLDADYKANALAQAKSYQNTMNMSKNAIYDQLTSEYGGKFTAEEAQYAIDNLQ